MSRVKAKDLRNLGKQELEQKKQALEKELHDLRQKKITGQLEKPHLFRNARKQIAQINTLKREK
jgi:large subunit ribosomal protein L29